MVKTMKQSYAFPRISTRGHYNLWTGEWNEEKHGYFLYPKFKFKRIEKEKEIVIFVHGMRNTRFGAVRGGRLLRNKLRKLGYKYPVIVFTYDADIREAHKPEKYNDVLKTAKFIALQNGTVKLWSYIFDLKTKKPKIKIHLVGHSLGCDVIRYCYLNDWLSKFVNVETIHLIGSPVEVDNVKKLSKYQTVINYYNPKDEVIKEGVTKGNLKKPSCLHRVKGITNRNAFAKDHRFKSYLKELKRFP